MAGIPWESRGPNGSRGSDAATHDTAEAVGLAAFRLRCARARPPAGAPSARGGPLPLCHKSLLPSGIRRHVERLCQRRYKSLQNRGL